MNEAAGAIRVQHVYDFAALDRVPEGPTSAQVVARRLLSGPTLQTGKSSTVAAVVLGRQIVVALGRQQQGSGSKAHTHANEQFNYILQGTMVADVEGDRVFAPKGTILHTPGMAVHTGLACPDEDLVFLAVKDTRHGIVGPPVDGKYDGPGYLPGFGSRAGEPRQSTAEMVAEARRMPPGPGMRYVYDMTDAAEPGPGAASAMVVTGAQLALPEGVTGKLLTGELLHVAVLRLPAGTTLGPHAHDNEQFAFVAAGMLEAELEGERMAVGERCVLHAPAGMTHALAAPHGALVLIAQDRLRDFSA